MSWMSQYEVRVVPVAARANRHRPSQEGALGSRRDVFGSFVTHLPTAPSPTTTHLMVCMALFLL